MVTTAASGSRTRLLAALAALALAASCSRQEKPAPEAARATFPPGLEARVAGGIEPGKPGGDLVVGAVAGPKTFHPWLASDASSTEIVHRIFDGLVELDCATGEYLPALASRWEVSADGRRWTFHVRRGVQWADGVPLTIEDLLWNFEAVLDESLGAPARESFSDGGVPFRVGRGDGETLVIETPRPWGPLLASLATEMPILPRHVWDGARRAGLLAEALGIDTPPDSLFGTGPYRLARSEPGRTVLSRNPNYWKVDSKGTRLPYAERIVFVDAGDWAGWRLKFEAGEVDQYIPRPDEVSALEDRAAAGGTRLFDLGPRSGTTHFWLNQNPGKDARGVPFVEPAKLSWFRDLRFRQALAHAIDREAIVRTCFAGRGRVIDGPVSPAERFWFNDHLTHYHHDPERARALLAEMGLTDRNGDGTLEDEKGRRVALVFLTNSENPVRIAMGRLIEADLRAVGVDARLETVEINTLGSRIQESYRYEGCLLALSGGEDPAAGLPVWLSSGDLHQFHPAQEAPSTDWERAADSLLSACMGSVDRGERKRLFDAVQELFAANLGWIYLANEETFLAVRDRFGNVRPGTLRSMNEFCWNEDEIFVR